MAVAAQGLSQPACQTDLPVSATLCKLLGVGPCWGRPLVFPRKPLPRRTLRTPWRRSKGAYVVTCALVVEVDIHGVQVTLVVTVSKSQGSGPKDVTRSTVCRGSSRSAVFAESFDRTVERRGRGPSRSKDAAATVVLVVCVRSRNNRRPGRRDGRVTHERESGRWQLRGVLGERLCV